MSLSVPQQRLQEWTKAQVSGLAGYPDDGQIASYLISLPSKQELGDYAKVNLRAAMHHTQCLLPGCFFANAYRCCFCALPFCS